MSICHHGINIMNHRCDICEEIAAAEQRCYGSHEQEFARNRAAEKTKRIKLLFTQAKAYAHCNCPEDPEEGRVTYHSNCQRKLMPILEELEGLL